MAVFLPLLSVTRTSAQNVEEKYNMEISITERKHIEGLFDILHIDESTPTENLIKRINKHYNELFLYTMSVSINNYVNDLLVKAIHIHNEMKENL